MASTDTVGTELPSPLIATTWYAWVEPIVTPRSVKVRADGPTSPICDPSRSTRYPMGSAPVIGVGHRG